MVIRQENGKKVIRLDLNSTELFNSPYYYLKANDIVLAVTGKSRVLGASRTVQVLPIVLGLSLAAIILTRVSRKNQSNYNTAYKCWSKQATDCSNKSDWAV